MKRILFIFLLLLSFCFSVSCGSENSGGNNEGNNNEETNDSQENETELIPGYNAEDSKIIFLAYEEAQTNGFEGSIDEFLALVKGEKGEQGEQGPAGPQGEQGEQGPAGPQGEAGKTPTVEINEDGYWVINGVVTEHKAVGENGAPGAQGESGATIKKLEFDEEGRLVITLTDGTKLPPVELPEKEKNEHTFGDWIDYTESGICTKRLFYRICFECRTLEWKQGAEDDHSIIYDCDSSSHWFRCEICGYKVGEEESHSIDNSGYCTVCDNPIGSTEGIVYEISEDGTYAKVTGYTGNSLRVIIADTYEDRPVTLISAEAFRQSELTSIIIPESVKAIGDRVFHGCASLRRINIPASIEEIGYLAFIGCSSLTEIKVDENNAVYKDIDGTLYTKDGKTLIRYASGKEDYVFTVPFGVEIIGTAAFSDVHALMSIEFSDSVITIENNAFHGCSNLSAIVLGDSVTLIEKFAFSECNSALYTTYENGIYVGANGNPFAILIDVVDINLVSCDINENTLIIADNVFYNCARLESIVIPDGVVAIGEASFYGCTRLAEVYVPDSVKSIFSLAFCDCSALTDVYYSGSEEEFANITVDVGNNAFKNATVHYNYVE